MPSFLPGVDEILLHATNSLPGSPWLEFPMRLLSSFGAWAIPLAVAAALLLAWGRLPVQFAIPAGAVRTLSTRDARLVLVALVCAVAISDLSSNTIKHQVSRTRPCRDPEVTNLVDHGIRVHGNRSFPSSHAANSAALATVASLAYPPAAPVAASLSFLVGASRVYGGVHYPSDVAAGWVLGMIEGAAVWAAFRKKASIVPVFRYAGRFRRRRSSQMQPPEGQWDRLPFHSLDGWECDALLHRNGRELAVLVHGLHGDIRFFDSLDRYFSTKGYSVLLVPLRGHDGHPCPTTTGGPDEAMDLAGALLAAEAAGFPAAATIVYGCSMGAAVAVKTACLLSASPVRGVIAHGCFTSFFESARTRLGTWRAMLLRMALPGPSRRSLDLFSPLAYLPLAPESLGFVFLHGSRDGISPPDMGTRLAKACRRGTLEVLGGAGHPNWEDSERSNSWQFEKAMDLALELIGSSGRRDTPLFVDEDGVLRDVPKLRERPTRGAG
jgi:membrane-associated phospholipid phosphatase